MHPSSYYLPMIFFLWGDTDHHYSLDCNKLGQARAYDTQYTPLVRINNIIMCMHIHGLGHQ